MDRGHGHPLRQWRRSRDLLCLGAALGAAWLGGCVATEQAPSAAFRQSTASPAAEPTARPVARIARSPLLDAGRLSSGFGWRRHPMGGGGAHHDGIDIAAPPGTPVRAAGMGLVVEIGWRGGYGRLVRISHTSRLETLYAHLSGFGEGLSVGGRVRQDQVIGYVGATGRTTGPHLHFEVHEDGAAADPLRFPRFAPRF